MTVLKKIINGVPLSDRQQAVCFQMFSPLKLKKKKKILVLLETSCFTKSIVMLPVIIKLRTE